MSVANTDGDGYGDKSGIVYQFDGTPYDDFEDGIQTRKVVRSGYGEPGPSPGDIVEMDNTKSNPDTSLPALDLMGQDGNKHDSCGEPFPAFACLGDLDEDNVGCGNSIEVGKSCASPGCARDWPAAVKRKTVRWAGQLEAHRRIKYAEYNRADSHATSIKDERKAVFNQLIISPPKGYKLDSDQPIERTKKLLKTILEKQFQIDGFGIIYHPYRIQAEYRDDKFDHPGEDGRGDMGWSDVLAQNNSYDYIYYSPHFHVYYTSMNKEFDPNIATAMYEQTGWLFKRTEQQRDSENEDSSISIYGKEELVSQLAYSMSHAPLRADTERDEMWTRLIGDLNGLYIPDGIEDQCLSIFCDISGKLLGANFVNLKDRDCEQCVGLDDPDDDLDATDCGCDADCGCDDGQKPIKDVWEPDASGSNPTLSGSNSWPSGTFGSSTADFHDSDGEYWTASEVSSSRSSESTVTATGDSRTDDGDDGSSDVSGSSTASGDDSAGICNGSYKPMWMAQNRLNNDEWCEQAEYADELEAAYSAYQTARDEDDAIWEPDRDKQDDHLDETGGAVAPR